MRRWISNGSVQSLRRLRDGRTTLDAVLKFKTLALQNLYGMSLDATETTTRDRLTWLHFYGLLGRTRRPMRRRRTRKRAGRSITKRRRPSRTSGSRSTSPFRSTATTHISIDKMHGIIRRQIVKDAAANDGKRLREGLIDPGNTCRDVWGDTGYRSAENERWLKEHGLNSRIHRKKPHKRPMSTRNAKANGRKSKNRAKVEHAFGHQKTQMELTIRTVGLARAKAAVTMANMAYNMSRLRWLLGRAKTASA